MMLLAIEMLFATKLRIMMDEKDSRDNRNDGDGVDDGHDDADAAECDGEIGKDAVHGYDKDDDDDDNNGEKETERRSCARILTAVSQWVLLNHLCTSA